MPEDGNRYEAIDGQLYVTPAPTVRHQRISRNLHVALMALLMEPGHGELLYAPVGVEFPETEEGVQPDLLFIRQERLGIVGEDWIRGSPDLVIEILSPGTAKRDRTTKRKLYDRQGVAEYWVVDSEAETIEVWDFAGEATHPDRYVDRVPVRVGGKRVGDIELTQIFPPRR